MTGTTTTPDTAKETTMIHLLLLAVRAVGPTAHQQHRVPPATKISGGDPRHNKQRKPAGATRPLERAGFR